ncbi:MAG: hypothetical protein AB9897_00425 [Anaerolineaceae bacterium]
MNDLAGLLNRTLAADIRFASIDLKNDQVWELTGSGGEPPSLAVQTTYGLRCRGIKIFPRFTLDGTTLTDPRAFSEPVYLKKRFADYLVINCSPFSSIDVELEYWVPSSNAICGRCTIQNNSFGSVTLNCDWAVLLQPLQTGEAMTNAEMGVNTILRGRAEDLYPVFFLTGGPKVSSKAYPSLTLEMTLAPGAQRRVSWALAAMESYESSFIMARQNTAQPWDSEILKREMEDKRKTFHFKSGDSQLDDLLNESQIKARQCLLQTAEPEERMTLLPKRQPDLPLGGFVVFPKTKMGNLPASVYDLWQASRALLPSAPEIIKALISGYVETQQADGAIPWAINPNGTATRALLPPFLGGIVCDLLPYLEGKTWLVQILPALIEAFKRWFAFGWPVWDHLLQTGLDMAPLYSRWNSKDQGVDMQYIDSPALGAMLYHECQSLLLISRWIGKEELSEWLRNKSEEIKTHVLAGWNDEKSSFEYRDIQSGETLSLSELYRTGANGSQKINMTLQGERRLLVRCLKPEGFPEITNLTIQGRNLKGGIEESFKFTPGQFQDGVARITSQQLFSGIEKIQLAGLQKTDSLVISLAGFDDEDISLALPLWAGILSQEQAVKFVENTLLPRYLTKYGLSCLPQDSYPNHPHTVMPFWNLILVEGLLKYGLCQQAATVLKSLYLGVGEQFKANKVMNDAIRVSDAQGVGNRDTLSSLPGLFPLLKVLGVEQVLSSEILFNGLNYYFPPFTVQYGKINVQLNQDCTTITTVNGSKVEIREPGMQKIILP